jgi:hypothetical protein
MELIQCICYLAIFSDAKICRELAKQNNATTIMPNQTWNMSNNTNRLAPQRLESIKNSYSELNLLSKTNPSDFIFDFDKAVTGVSTGTGGRTVAATVSLQTISFSIHSNISFV